MHSRPVIIYLGWLSPTSSLRFIAKPGAGSSRVRHILQQMGFTTTYCHQHGIHVDRGTFHLCLVRIRDSIVSVALSLPRTYVRSGCR